MKKRVKRISSDFPKKSEKNSIYRLLIIGLIILILLFIVLILIDIFGKKENKELGGELGSLSPIGQEPIQETLLKEATAHSGVVMGEENKGYIIELKSKPFFENRAGGIAYKQQLREEHIALKQQIEQALGKSIGDDIELFDEFEDVFNGIALDISKTECEFLKNRINTIKECYPNLEVHTLLDKSLKVINADIAYSEFGLTGENVVIAVIDTGIDSAHESLDDLDDNYATDDKKIIGFKDFVNFKTISYDDHGHGTHVSGIAAGTGGTSIYRGVAPKAKLVGVKVLDRYGSGTFSNVIAGIEWVIQNKDKYNISVISMSLGANLNSDGTTPVEIAATTAVENGISFVVAAGNRGPGSNTVGIPASAKKVITVGAVDNNKNIAGFSSRGPTKDGRIKPEVSAPGVNTMAPDANTKNRYASHSGTSMATPHVSGVVALLKQANSSLNADEIRQLLMDSALDKGEIGADNVYGWGVVDALQALLKIYPQDHELLVDNIKSQDIYDTNTPIKITALIKNKGANNESNIKVRFFINGIEQSLRIIDSINSGSETSLDFIYASNKEGNLEATISIEPVNEENILFDNNLSKEIIIKDYLGKLKAVVADSWGTYSSQYSIFPELNDYWYDFGDYKIEIDYESFNGKETTYELLKQSNADVIIISDAWQDGGWLPGKNWEFSDSEIEAIKQYVGEGHGLIITSGTLSTNSPGNVQNNMKLAPLVGLDENSNAYWAGRMTDSNFNINYLNHELFNNMTKYLYGERSTNIGLNLSQTDPGDILAKSYDELSIITGHYYGLGNTIYFANMVEYGMNVDDRQIFYNAILWTNKNYEQKSHDLKLYNLSLEGVIKYGETSNISARLVNKGSVAENNINIKLLINNSEEKNIIIPSLNVNEETNVNFEFILNKTGTQSVVIKIDAIQEESKEYDNSIGKNVFVPKASLTGVAKDYGIDIDSDGLLDYLAIDIELNVIESGDFSLEGLLTSQLGVEFEKPNAYDTFSSGLHNLTLKFNGLGLRRIGLNGPYKLKDLELFDGQGSIFIDSLYNTAYYSYDKFESYPDLSVSDVISGGEDDSKIIVNQSSDIEVFVENIGTEDAFNINVSLYQHDTQNYDNLIFINSSIINNISVFEEKSVVLKIIPQQFGYVSYSVNVSDAEDGNLENNNYNFGLEVFAVSADLRGYFDYMNKAIVNKNLTLKAIIENNGVEKAQNIVVSFYREECDNGCNYILIDSKDIGNLSADETKETSLILTPTKLGGLVIIGNITADNEVNKENNRFAQYIDIIPDGADVAGNFYSITYPFIINKEGKLSIWLRNIGTKKADNINATLYEDNEGTLKKISSIFIETLESDEQHSEEVSWTPTKAGNNNLVLKINADNDMNLANNEVKGDIDVRLESPDVAGYFNYGDNKLVLNKESNISVNAENRGVIEAQNVIISLYKEVCDEFWVCNYILISSKNLGNIKADERKNINFSYTPNEIRWQRFKINISANNEIEEYKSNNENTFGIGVVSEVDLHMEIQYFRTATINKNMNITSYVRNNGIQTAQNAVVSLYENICDEFGGCNYVLVSSKNIGNINADEYREVNFSYTPAKLGWQSFKINVTASNEGNYNDNENYLGFEVVNNGPDISVNLRAWEIGNSVVNNEVLIPAEISNIGNQDANNILLTLYNVSYDNGEQLTQIEQKTITSLSASENTRVMFSYTPVKSGWIEFKLISTLANDVYSGNNYYNSGLNVLNSVTDVSGIFLFYNSYAIKNKINYLDIEIRDNDVIGAKNVSARLYDNGNLLNSFSIPKINASDVVFYKDIVWTPTSLGTHNLTLIVTADDDIKLENNIYTQFIDVYDSVQTTFNIRNSSGNNIPRYLTVNEDRFFVDNSYIAEITKLGKLNIGVDNVHYWKNSVKEVFTVFLNSGLNSEMNIMSEYHENITDRDLFFDIVYANNPSWIYNNLSYYMFYYGLQNPKDVTVYGCLDWNFSSLHCNSEWIKNNENVKYIGEEGVYVTGDIGGVTSAVGLRNIIDPSCGNGVCGVGEDCNNCASDCGVCPAPCSSPECGGGSGGGGGGGGGGSETRLFSTKSANKSLNIKIENNDLDIEFLGLRFVNEQQAGFVQFKKLVSLGNIFPPPNNNYAYFSITHPNIQNENIKDGNIIFRVSKKWLTDNNVSKDNIMLLRYNDSWKELLTNYQNSDNLYNYYRSDINALSVFAISAKQTGEQAKEGWFKIKPYVYVVIIIMIIVLALVILIMKFTSRQKKLGKDKEIENK